MFTVMFRDRHVSERHPSSFNGSGSGGGGAETEAAGWADWITQPLVLTKTSLVLMRYQVSVETQTDSFTWCRLYKNADVLPGTIAITGGSSQYGTISGQWVGTMPAGTHSIKLNCRNNGVTELGAYFETQDLSVTVLG